MYVVHRIMIYMLDRQSNCNWILASLKQREGFAVTSS